MGVLAARAQLFYNLTVTALSVVVAFGVGAIELLAVTAERFGLTGGPWGLAARVDLSLVGYGVVGVFAVTWALALAAWRIGRIEERWGLADGG